MASYNQVSLGSTDKESVKKLQELLNSNGNYNLSVDGIFGKNTLAAVKDYQKNNNLAVDGIVGANTWGALTKAQDTTTATPTEPAQTETPKFSYEAYKPSDAVTQAEALLKQHMAQKPGDYTSAWQTQLNDTINKILNREKFSYDLNGDALYQQYKDQYTTQGKMAMMDTMGQAQAMTGGYGNSYAQTAGQQAYQGYLQQLNERVPELYQLALNQYNAEGNALYDQASLMASMEEQDYGRYRDQMSDYYTELDRLTSDSRYQSEMDYSKWSDDQNFRYGQYRDYVADEQWQAQFDEGKRQFDEQMALSKKKSSGGGSGGGGYNNGNVDTANIKKMQEALGVTADGKWGPATQAAAKAKWGVTSANDAWTKFKDGNGNGALDVLQRQIDKLNNSAAEIDSNYVANSDVSYYDQILNDLIIGKSKGRDNKWASDFLQDAVSNGLIKQSAYMTLYNRYRDDDLTGTRLS